MQKGKEVSQLLKNNKQEDAVKIAMQQPTVLNWRDAGFANRTLMHWAVDYNCSDFLNKLFEEEKVFLKIINK